MNTTHVLAPVDTAAELTDEMRDALRDLILCLADNKRLLGIRYSDWMLGAPTLETGIAASSMAQDEWGHGRLTYALLSDFGDDPRRLEHERGAEEYRSMEALDAPFGSWAEMIAASLLLDSALSVQYSALVESRYTPVHNRVQKLLDEETFHFQYADGWAQRVATSPATRDAFETALGRFLPQALRWLGRPGGPLQLLEEAGVVRAGADATRAHYLQRVGPVLARLGMDEALGVRRDGEGWQFIAGLDWTGWDDRRRRAGGTGPDADTLARVRGDKNRAMLLD